jgi:hypothetical protein
MSPGGPIVRAPGDRGALPVKDAAVLPSGAVLVALGEAGIRILAPDGRVLFRAFEPAHVLVVSDHGDRALALAPRGERVWRIARVDVVGRRVQAWCDAHLDTFATDFDGASWILAARDSLYAIDVTQDGWQHTWRSDAYETHCLAISRDSRTLSVARVPIGKGASDGEVWMYDVAGYVLRRRRRVAPEGWQLLGFGRPAPDGKIAVTMERDDAGGRRASRCIQVLDESGWSAIREVASADESIGPMFEDGVVLSTLTTSSGVRVSVDRKGSTRGPATISLEGAARVAMRRRGGRLLVADDHGRVLLYALESGTVVHEWRVS